MSDVDEKRAALVREFGVGVLSGCVDLEAAVRADERERCARVADESDREWMDAGMIAKNIAAAIRKGRT